MRPKELIIPELEPGTYPVMESFYTLQGEGAYTGTAAYFIRLAGCNVGCSWCDVKESWDPLTHPVLPIEQLLEAASAHPAKFLVITGGEPLMYNLTQLTSAFKSKGFYLSIETSGAYPLSGYLDWICVSPKKFMAPKPEVLEKANELKVVVYNKNDFAWAETHAKQVGPDCKLFLQPEWSRMQKMMPLIIDYVKAHPKWRVSLQTHKFMDIP